MSATVTAFSFNPSDTATPPYNFAFTAESENYTGQCTWNVARQDWYLQLYDSAQNLIINHPLVSSPVTAPQNLAPGAFFRSVLYYTANIAQITVVERPFIAQPVLESIPYLGQDLVETISINDIVVTINGGATPVTTAFNVLATKGSSIVDTVTGSTVILKVINWFGGEGTNYVPDGMWQVSYKNLIDQVAAWGFNCIRLPFSGDTFKQSAPGAGAINVNAKNNKTGVNDNLDFTTNQSLTSPVFKSVYGIFDTLIQYCAAKGIRIILDHHRRTAGSGGDGAPTDDTYTQTVWQETWASVASHYAAANGFANVCGADIYNEPYALTWTDWVTAANGAIAAIQQVNSDWLMIVEGVGTYNGVSAWYGAQLQGVSTLQPTPSVANKLVYSPHDYGQSVGAQSWLETTTNTVVDYPHNLPALWDSLWGYINEGGIAPILIGEFGGKLGVNGSGAVDGAQVNAVYEQQWISKLCQYLKNRGMSYGYWALNPDSGDTGGLLEDDWVTPQATKIALIQSILAE